MAAALGSSVDAGLSASAAAAKLAEHGPNVVSPPKTTPLWAKFILAFFSGFAPMLWIATFFVFLSWEPFGTPPSNVYNLILALVLLFVISASALLTFAQEFQSALVMEARLGQLTPSKMTDPSKKPPTTPMNPPPPPPSLPPAISSSTAALTPKLPHSHTGLQQTDARDVRGQARRRGGHHPHRGPRAR